MIGQYSQSQSQSQGSQGAVAAAAGGGSDFLPFSGMLGSEWPTKDGLALDVHLEQKMKLSAKAATFAPVYTEAFTDHMGEQLVTANAIKPITWHPVFLAQAVLAEFCTIKDWKTPLKDVLQANLYPDPEKQQPQVDDELKRLVYYAMAERPRRLPEILKQADDFRPYFNSLLGGNMVGKAACAALIETGLAVGMMVAMHFKYEYNRPRPWQIYPPLLPPVTTPAHPSFPNGHALQSHIIARCLGRATYGALWAPAKAMADRIGKNREFLGVHFPSDTKASERLAKTVVELLMGTPRFKEVLARAGSELSDMEPIKATVILTKAGDRKADVINVVRELGMKEAEALVEGAPKWVKEGIGKDEVVNIKKKLGDAGATVAVAATQS